MNAEHAPVVTLAALYGAGGAVVGLGGDIEERLARDRECGMKVDALVAARQDAPFEVGRGT